LHPPEVPGTLLPHGGHEEEGDRQGHLRPPQHPGQRHEGGQPPAVVGDPGGSEAGAFPAQGHRRPGGKGRVQVGRHHQGGFIRIRPQIVPGHHIPGGIQGRILEPRLH
ncbi:hypothetical protein RZS08_01295, partial [Arthrospira platensis SPKY1]|nr:hypothetical protein [Arthrospira platensis SPKY1]